MSSGCKVWTQVWGDPKGQGADPIHACHVPGTVPGAPLMESDQRLPRPCRVEVAVSVQLRYSARFSNLSEVTQHPWVSDSGPPCSKAGSVATLRGRGVWGGDGGRAGRKARTESTSPGGVWWATQLWVRLTRGHMGILENLTFFRSSV